MEQTKGIGYSEKDLALKKGKNYLLAIGINDYLHCPKLNNAVKDVRDLIALLTERYGFDNQYITTLIDKEATSRNITNAFRQLAQKVTADDNLIIYFSGHGEFDKVLQQGFWIPVDAEKGEFDDYLPNSTIRDVLNAINSRHTFLIADSCFSGSLFSSRDANRDISSRLESEPSRWGLTSGRNEIVSDGAPNTNSPFSAKLLDLLRRNDKSLGAAELCAKMMEIVAANAQQTPRGEPLKIKGHEGGQFFFHLKNNELEDWQAAVAANTVIAYQKFIEKHPLSMRLTEAQNAIIKLQKDAAEKAKADAELKAYHYAKQQKTIAALTIFLRDYPLSKNAEEIEILLGEAEYEAAWKEAKNVNTLTAYRAFSRKYPTGKYADDCQKRIEAIFQNVEPAPVSKPEPTVVVPPPKVEKVVETPPSARPENSAVKKEEKPPKTAYVSETSKVSETSPDPIEPSFIQKYKIHLVGVGLLLVAFLIWKMTSGDNSQPSPPYKTDTPSVSAEETAFAAAKSSGTIPIWEDFVGKYPNSPQSSKAKTELENLKTTVAGKIADAKTMMKRYPKDAKAELEAALKIDPNNSEILNMLENIK